MNSHPQSLRKGFSLLEVVFSSAIFLIIASALVTLVLQQLSVAAQSQEYLSAVAYAEEGRDMVRVLRKSGFDVLGTVTDGGLSPDGYGGIRFDGSPNAFGIFERRTTVEDIARFDGGANDGSTKRVTIRVAWPIGAATQRTVTLTDYLVHWEGEY